MFRAKTLLVIGAGASAELGLPIGPELLKQIVTATNITFQHQEQRTGERAITQALKLHLNEDPDVKQINEHLHAGWQLAESSKQALSIDNVIDALEDPMVELMGKLGIAHIILKAESSSQPFKPTNHNPDNLDMGKFDKTWYSSLTKVLTENVKKSKIDLIFNNLKIVNFNYDRCLEHYLPISISKYYGLPVEEIRPLMKNLVIHRPYGVVGRLPWQDGTAPSVAFGDGNARNIQAVAQQIRTFTERVEEAEELHQIKKSVADADRIVFLGFAFHRQNVELLSSKAQDHSEVVATTFQISESDKNVIDDELSKALQFRGLLSDHRVTLANLTCKAFFDEHWRTLTAEKGDHTPFDLSEHMPRMPSIPSFPSFKLPRGLASPE